MKKVILKFFTGLFIVLLFLGFGYYYQADIVRLWQELSGQLKPCQQPIAYSIQNIDPLFGLTKAAVENNVGQAEKIWEAPINKQLFQSSPTGALKINLVYDYRQKATDALRKMGIVINDDRASYDILKAKYDSLLAEYKKEKAQVDALTAAFDKNKIAFEAEANYWNSRGGAPKTEYNLLEQKRADLNNQVTAINQANDSLNSLIDTVNSAGIVLNKLITTLNLQIGDYNTVGSSTGKKFTEGEYVRDANGTTINIFQFNDASQLRRVLAHELGHALGLEHLPNSKAIMYYLNEGVNEKLTADDLAALKTMCGIE